MKKITKNRLALHTETVRTLVEKRLEEVRGGAAGDSFLVCPTLKTCPSSACSIKSYNALYC